MYFFYSLNKKDTKCSNENINSKRVGSGRRADYPELEELLFEAIKSLRDKGLVVKYSKIKALAKNIATRKDIDITGLKMCDNWVYRFCQRYGISDRAKTHTSQEFLKILVCKFTARKNHHQRYQHLPTVTDTFI